MSPPKMPKSKTVLSTAASVAASSAMLMQKIAKDFIPKEVQAYLFSSFYSLIHRLSSEFTIVIEEFQGLTLNQVFEAADIYSGTKVTPSTQRVQLGKSEEEKSVTIRVDQDKEIVDVFHDVQVTWILICTHVESNTIF
ncbi:hypothetical protein RJ639_020985 [Escallonia herrerae]|uniref:AAA-type ATPase N-terminal domain-containing protein n=1 Tax=Escallonia herrerae TaxID=1293975 RepID=A0AA88V2Z6_9ASTE|nr:hypothetical protein RJ639_020985 [Escallonia herrerae]